ncbi:MAG: hypothetical protein DCF31_04895 [Alphaproteobacteria bacterium]|nr:MAG: hypothetical protein DCF31_04895 [Alphaproteobacteria bacterium]
MTEAAPSRRAGGNGIARILMLVVLVVVLLAALVYGTTRWIDTESGRNFIVRQLPGYKPASGLTIRAGRIDGSLFGKATIHDIVIGDATGTFATIPQLAIDWRPLDLLQKRFTAKYLLAPEFRILRKPALRPSDNDRILPDFDFDIARLQIDRLVLEPPVSGRLRVLGVGGSADIRAGRARVKLAALTLAQPGVAGSGDTVRLSLDSEPDRNVFDVDALVTAPRGGAIAGMLGLAQPLDIAVSGDGSWQVWQGKLAARLGGTPLADIALTARSGLFTARGTALPARLLTGVASRLAGPVLNIDGSVRVEGSKAQLALRAATAALTAEARGGVDFDDESIENMAVTARLIDPRALNPAVSARDMRLSANLAGTLTDPLIDYRLTAASAGWRQAVATDIRATGIVRGGQRPLVIPVSLSAARLTGLGDVAAPLLTNIRIDGPLTLAGGRLVSKALAFRSDRLNGTATADVVDGNRFLLTVKGGLPRYLVPGLGLADILADLRVVPAPGGARVTGRTDIKVTRLDNGFFAALTDGLPRIAADIDVLGDLSLAFSNARLTSPGITLLATGTRTRAGLVTARGSGTSRDYGPLTLALQGPIDRPVVDVVLARPGFGIGLANVAANVAPAPEGWRFVANGASTYGPVTGRGLIRTATSPVTIDIASATIAGLTGQGRIAQTAAGPFAGRIGFNGPGLNGTALLAATGAVQRADIEIAASDAQLALDVPVTIDKGSLRLSVLLPAGGPSATGNFSVSGIERDGLRIDKGAGSIAYAAGRGRATAAISGTTSANFALDTAVDFTPDRVTVTASGKLDNRPVQLSGPAVLTRSAAGWALAPVSITTPDGNAELSGLFGARKTLHARFDRVSLALLTTAWPALDFSGRISGNVDLAFDPGNVPSGTATLRLNSLSRAGLASASTPIDVGLNAELSQAGIVARAVIVRGGRVEGRAQARVGPIGAGSGTLTERLFASPVFAQARYNGPAQSLWGLSGIEALDVRGPIAVAADVRGQLGDPQITGTARAAGARVESTLLGAVVDQVSLDSRFTASRLDLTRFSGRAGRDGTITGTGGIDLSAERGFPMDIRLALKNAQLLDRDDYTGTASGTVRIATDPYGGVVSGKLTVEKASFRLGRAAAVEVPVLQVTERNTRVLGRRAATYLPPQRWLLSLDVRGDRRLMVSGMGVESEWSADVRIKGGARTPEIIGRVDLVRGDYDFAGKRFNLTKGALRFAGGYPPDPIIDVSATSTTAGFTAQLDIDGTATRPEIRFSSVPSLPEDEVLSRVLFGSSVTNLSAPEAIQLAGALASLRGGGGGLNPINAVRKGLGIDRLRILPADTANGRKTAVAAGQYIGRNVYVELATDAQGYTATNIEVSLTRSLSILSEVATLGGTSANLRWKRDY